MRAIFAPFFEGQEPADRFGTAEPEAFGEAQRVFIEEAAQMLLRAGAVFDDALVSGE